jgi:hypothetical protein
MYYIKIRLLMVSLSGFLPLLAFVVWRNSIGGLLVGALFLFLFIYEMQRSCEAIFVNDQVAKMRWRILLKFYPISAYVYFFRYYVDYALGRKREV